MEPDLVVAMDDLHGFATPAGSRLGRPLIVKAVTGSTNDDARSLAAAGAGHGTAVLADQQTAGRGRLGRAWSSPAGENLYLSVIWRAGLGETIPPTMTLAAGVAVSEALDRFTPSPTRVKWPNDVRHRGKKLAGVLTEAMFRGAQPTAVVLGVGVNVRGGSVAPELADIATTLRAVRGSDLSRAEVLGALLSSLDEALSALMNDGFAVIRARLLARCETIGARVSVGGVTGVATDVDDDGALLVRDDEGAVHVVRSGEVR